jgi:hypothetical protein
MNNQKIISLILVVAIVLPVFAISVNAFGAASPKPTKNAPIQTQIAQNQAERMVTLKTRSAAEIKRRTKALAELITKINEMKRLTSSEKSKFTTDIQNNIDSLTALGIKIEAGNDFDTLKADAKSIVDSYRIFALYMPKIRILSGAERQLASGANLQEISTKLSDLTTKVAAKGKDVTAIKTKLTEMNTKIISAQTNTQAAYDAVLNLEPSGFPANKGSLTAAAEKLKAAQTQLNNARLLAVEIRNMLKAMLPTATP